MILKVEGRTEPTSVFDSAVFIFDFVGCKTEVSRYIFTRLEA